MDGLNDPFITITVARAYVCTPCSGFNKTLGKIKFVHTANTGRTISVSIYPSLSFLPPPPLSFQFRAKRWLRPKYKFRCWIGCIYYSYINMQFANSILE